MSAVIGALRGVLSMDSAAFETGAKRAKATMGTVERRMVALAGKMEGAGRRMALGLTLPMAAAAGVAVRSSLKVVDAQAKMAQSLGTTVASMQVLERAADLSGVSMGEMQQATLQLTKRLSQAAGGSGAAAKALDRLNLSATELQALPLDERLSQIQSALAAYVPEAERAAVASDLFGSRAGLIFTRIDGAALRIATEDVSRFGLAVSELDADQIELTNDALSRMSLAGRGLANQLTVALAPSLQSLADGFASVAAWFASLDEGSKRLTAGIAATVAAVGPLTLGLGLLLRTTAPVVQGMLSLATAARTLGVALTVATGPWGILAALVAGTAGYFLVFRDNAETLPTPLEEATKAQQALSGAMGLFYETSAPSAAKAAVETATKYYEYAKAAREAAAANIAVLQSELAMQQGVNDGLKFGNFFGDDEEDLILEDLAAARAELAKAERLLEDARRKQKQAATAVTGGTLRQSEATQDLSSNLSVAVETTADLGSAMGQTKIEAEDLAEGLQTDLPPAISGVAQAFGDLVGRGFRDFKDFWGDLKRLATRELANLAALFAQNQLKVALGISLSGAGTASNAAGSFLAGSGGGGGLMPGLLGQAATGLFGGSSLLAGLGGGFQAALGLGGFTSAGIFNIASNAALASAATGASALVSTIGAALPVVGIIAGGLALLSKAFGRKFEYSALEGTIGADGFDGYTRDFYKGGWFRSNKTVYGAVDPVVDTALDQQVEGLTSNLLSMSEALGLGSDALADFEGYSLSVMTSGRTQEQIQQDIADHMAAATEQMADLILGTDAFSRAGESASETLARLSGSLLAVNDAMDLLGAAAFDVSLGGADLASDLVEKFGGADQLAASVSSYFSGFYTQAERSEVLLRRLREEFEALGISMPASRDAFREIVESLDLTTEGGQNLYAELLRLSGAMDEVLPQIGSFTAELSGMAQEIGGEIGVQIDAARDMVSEARAAAGEWRRTAEGLRGFVSDLLATDLSAASGAQSAAAQRSRLDAAFAGVQAGDATAAADLPGLARTYLRSAREAAGSDLEYRRIAAEVQAQLSFAAGVAELEAGNDEVLAGLYAQQIEVLTSLGTFLQLEGLTADQVANLSDGVQALAEDWDGTVAAFEASMSALESAIETAEGFSYDDLVGALDVAVTLDETAPRWLRRLVGAADEGIRTTLDFIIRRDDLTPADRWIATQALSEHVATLNLVLGEDLDRGSRRLALTTAADLRRRLMLDLGRDLDPETRALVLTRSANLSRRVNVALTTEGADTVARLTRLSELIRGRRGGGRLTFDGGVVLEAGDVFADLASQTERLRAPLDRLREMLGALRDAIDADRQDRELQLRITRLQARGETVLARTEQGQDVVDRFNALRAQYGVGLAGHDATVTVGERGYITPSFESYRGGDVVGFWDALRETFGTSVIGDVFRRSNEQTRAAYERAQQLRQQIRSLGGIPAFRQGGAHQGGARIVGEAGWEIEHTGPSRIHSHAESVAMLDNRPLTKGVAELTRHVVAQGQVVQLLLNKLASKVDDWDDFGLPGERR
ncbi:MAG: tail tape measure protein [Epibacterium sp.]